MLYKTSWSAPSGALSMLSPYTSEGPCSKRDRPPLESRTPSLLRHTSRSVDMDGARRKLVVVVFYEVFPDEANCFDFGRGSVSQPSHVFR